ncbi:MAG: lysophospholipase, partial [Chloroflexi bacterium]|nr:lysophospholipase [Chloroflexota bacterium]
RRDMTNDDLHLNGTGYRTWVEQIQPLIESLD